MPLARNGEWMLTLVYGIPWFRTAPNEVSKWTVRLRRPPAPEEHEKLEFVEDDLIDDPIVVPLLEGRPRTIFPPCESLAFPFFRSD
jgi:hypothetical protein